MVQKFISIIFRDAKQITDEKRKTCSELEIKVTDLDDKWGKSKRINKQKQDKIDSLEKELESSKASGSSSTAEMSTLQTKLKEIEKSVEGKDIKIKELEKELSTKKAAPSTSSNSSQLQTENEKLKKEVQELKSKSNSAPGSSSYAASKEIKDLKDAISKHELSEEQLVIAKAKLTTENEELEGT